MLTANCDNWLCTDTRLEISSREEQALLDVAEFERKISALSDEIDRFDDDTDPAAIQAMKGQLKALLNEVFEFDSSSASDFESVDVSGCIRRLDDLHDDL
jgi:uncharacterized small protein (DUF1192 family)